MTTITQHAPGTFSWPELSTTDQEGAKKFYLALFGWTAQDNDMGGNGTYTILRQNGKDVGALCTLQPQQVSNGTPPHWLTYVSVESADQSAARAKELGGQVHLEPFDVFDLGRMAVIQDPTGAAFAIWEAKKHIGAGVLDENGAMTWNELLTRDPKKAAAFYTGVFPWKAEVMPMDNVDYTVFKRGEANAGGMFQITPEMGPMPAFWSVYFQVEDTDAMTAKAVGLGAKVMMPPTDVPHVGRFATLQDPQGAVFSFMAYAKQA
jgi:predicted enzyme related to lactoylglutathione lyase